MCSTSCPSVFFKEFFKFVTFKHMHLLLVFRNFGFCIKHLCAFLTLEPVLLHVAFQLAPFKLSASFSTFMIMVEFLVIHHLFSRFEHSSTFITLDIMTFHVHSHSFFEYNPLITMHLNECGILLCSSSFDFILKLEVQCLSSACFSCRDLSSNFNWHGLHLNPAFFTVVGSLFYSSE